MGAAGNVITDAPGIDIDPDGDSLAVVGLAAGNQLGQLAGHVGEAVESALGILTMQADGTWSYLLKAGGPDIDQFPDHQIHDVFSYTISDGHGGYDTATLDILIGGYDGGATPGGLSAAYLLRRRAPPACPAASPWPRPATRAVKRRRSPVWAPKVWERGAAPSAVWDSTTATPEPSVCASPGSWRPALAAPCRRGRRAKQDGLDHLAIAHV